MSRRLALVLGVCAVLLSGCTAARPPQGTDGDLVDDWTMIAAAQWSTPRVGDCFTASKADLYVLDDPDYAPTPCTETHDVEVVGTGTYPDGADARVPKDGDPAFGTARTQCVAAADAYLGGDYRTATVYLKVGEPDYNQWSGGDRTYTCELGRDEGNGPADAGTLATSLKGGLTGTRDAAWTCAQTNGTTLDKYGNYSDTTHMTPVPCNQAHDSEYAGPIDPLTDTWPVADSTTDSAFGDRCQTRIAALLGITAAKLRTMSQYYTEWWWPSAKTWALGDHDIRCYVNITYRKKVSASLAGFGARTIT